MSEVSRGRILPKRRSRARAELAALLACGNLTGTATTTPPTNPVDRGLQVSWVETCEIERHTKNPSEPSASLSELSLAFLLSSHHQARRRPFFDDVGHLPASRRCRERNLCTLCWGKRAAGKSSALPRRQLASSPFTLHEHGRGRLEHLLRQTRLRVGVRRRLRGLRPAHAAHAPAATGLQPTAPHRVNTSGTRGTPCPLHQHCHSHRNASGSLGWLLRRRQPGRRVPGWPVRHRLRRLRHAPTAAYSQFTPGRDGSIRLPALDGRLCDGWPRHTVRGAA